MNHVGVVMIRNRSFGLFTIIFNPCLRYEYVEHCAKEAKDVVGSAW